MNKQKKHLGWIILVLALSLTFGCTKEKAEAIKIAAENFRMEAVSAIKKVNSLFIQSVSLPSESADAETKRIATDLEKEEVIDAKKIGFLLQEKSTGQRSADKINQEFEGIELRYYQFEGMFRSLPQGSYFAQDAVKKAEKHAIQLTLELMNFGGKLKDYPVQFTGRRVSIQERVQEAKQIKDLDARRGLLMLAAGDLLKLRNEEEAAKQEAITQCLKAAESGRLLTHLIRNYDTMNVEDMLNSVRNTLGLITEISGGQKDLVSLLETYKAAESQIRKDPYWKEVLSLEVPK